MRYKYKVRELGPRQLGMQNEEYVEVGEAKDMEAMSLKKLKRRLDSKKEYHIQWSILLLELNMIKNAWRPYGVNIEMSAPGLKRIVEWGTKKYGIDHSK
jgi:hypothetical protein